jgi:SAM-dependent methyltransferase
MLALAKLEFASFLDIGGAEGYKSALVRQLFNAPVRSCDLSEEAIRRAKEIFGVDGQVVDIANLPFEDSSYDVVACSETLEHVVDIRAAVLELLRVARRAVVITVPKESIEEVERNIREKVPHGHIHALDLDSFNWTRAEGVQVIARRISSRGLLSLPMKMVAAEVITHRKHSALLTWTYNQILRRLWLLLFGKGAASRLLASDDRRSGSRSNSRGLLFVLVKDPLTVRRDPRPISPRQILDFAVPFHFPG